MVYRYRQYRYPCFASSKDKFQNPSGKSHRANINHSVKYIFPCFLFIFPICPTTLNTRQTIIIAISGIINWSSVDSPTGYWSEAAMLLRSEFRIRILHLIWDFERFCFLLRNWKLAKSVSHILHNLYYYWEKLFQFILPTLVHGSSRTGTKKTTLVKILIFFCKSS